MNSPRPIDNPAPGHAASTYRYDRGRTKLRCECGFTDKINQAPTAGGRVEMERSYAVHVGAVYWERLNGGHETWAGGYRWRIERVDAGWCLYRDGELVDQCKTLRACKDSVGE